MIRSTMTAVVCMAIFFLAQPAGAQEKAGLKIGVVAVQRAFNEAAEAKEINARADQAQKDFTAQVTQKSKERDERGILSAPST